MLSLNDLHILNSRNKATPNKKYYGIDGRVYVGTKEGRLRLEPTSSETTFSPTTSIDENNVQNAIESISDNADTNAQNAVGSILTDTSTIDFTYNSATPSITADVINSSITYSKIQDVSASRLLGRATASIGVTEEITLGTGLSFAATILNVSGVPSISITDDNTTNTIMYPLWSSVSSGVATLSASSTKLNFNPSTGSLFSAGNLMTPQIYGSASANGDILIDGTSNATKTSSYVLLQSTGGNVGIGTLSANHSLDILSTSSTTQSLNISQTNTGANSVNYGVRISYNTTPSANIQVISALRADFSYSGTVNNTETIFGPTCMVTVATNNSTGTITNYAANRTSLANNSTGIISNFSGYQVNAAANIGGGTVTNMYAFKVLAQTVGSTLSSAYYAENASATGRYNLYMNGTAQNYLAGNLGIGQTTTTAYLHIKAGTATANTAPIKLTSGTNLTTAETGAFEYNGTNLFFTRTGTTRESVLTGNSGAAAPTTSVGVSITNYYGSSATNFLGTPNSWTSVVIGGTTYKIPLYT